MAHKKSRPKGKPSFIRLHKNRACQWRTLPIKKACILMLCLVSLTCATCVTEKELGNLESSLNAVQEEVKDRNEKTSQTEIRLVKIEESRENTASQLLTLRVEYQKLLEKYAHLSEKLETMTLTLADMDLQIVNRLKDLKSEIEAKNANTSQEFKKLTRRLQTPKQETVGPGTKEVIELRGQLAGIEKRIEEIESTLLSRIQEENQNTPESPYEEIMDVIHKFEKYYGGPQMDEIPHLTTAKFRENRPGAVWVAEIWKALDALKYKRLDSVVKKSKIEQDRALVVLESDIRTTAGKAKQKEVFYLIQKEGRWLIDKIVIADEKTDLGQLDL